METIKHTTHPLHPQKRLCRRPGVWCTPVISATQEMAADRSKFEASLDNTQDVTIWTSNSTPRHNTEKKCIAA